MTWVGIDKAKSCKESSTVNIWDKQLYTISLQDMSLSGLILYVVTLMYS